MNIKKTLMGAMLLGLIASLLVGCGGETGGGRQPAVDTNLEPLDFTFNLDRESLTFAVVINSETEVRGTSMISTLTYHWTAENWVQTDSSWTADVVFKNIKSISRRGTLGTAEHNESFDRMEGLVLSYELIDGSFDPIREPAKEPEYMGMLAQLRTGVATIGLDDAPEPVYPGSSWEIVIPAEDLGPLATVTDDSTVNVSYKGDEMFMGRDCAKLQMRMKMDMDGIIESEENRVKLSGKNELNGDGMMDKERGFLLKLSQREKTMINQQLVDKRGKAKGSAQSFTQNKNISVNYVEK